MNPPPHQVQSPETSTFDSKESELPVAAVANVLDAPNLSTCGFEPFTYSPLAPDEIRLLYVDRTEAGLIWSLKTVQLLARNETGVEYDALSYTWGELGEVFPFVCDGKMLLIHKNLHEALPFLAKRNSKFPIWIDAVCINQDDDNEKISQIPRMGRLYGQASMVWVWLGVHVAETEDAIALLPRLIELTRLMNQQDNNLSLRLVRPEHRVLPDSASKVWDAINRILRSAWFNRLWIVQEACLARELRFLNGPHEIHWVVLRELWEYRKHLALFIKDRDGREVFPLEGLNFHHSSIFVLRDPDPRIHRTWSELQSSINYGDADLTHAKSLFIAFLATLGGNLACSNPADRVFAILGMGVDDRGITNISQGALPIGELYTRFCAFLLFSHESIPERYSMISSLFLYTVSLKRIPSENNYDMPSWVPNCNGRLRHLRNLWSYTPPILKIDPVKRIFRLSGGLLQNYIALGGLIYDTVAEIYPEFPDLPHCQDKHDAARRIELIGNWEYSVGKRILQQDQPIVPGKKFCRQLTSLLSLNEYRNTLIGFHGDGKRLSNHKEFKGYRLLFGALTNTSLGSRCNSSKSKRSRNFGIEFVNTIANTLQGRRLLRTSGDRLGFANHDVQPGDLLCSFNRIDVTFVLRSAKDRKDQGFLLISDAFVHGMTTEKIDTLGLEEQDIIVC